MKPMADRNRKEQVKQKVSRQRLGIKSLEEEFIAYATNSLNLK